MKNKKIIESWDKILPDEAADERMLSSIMKYKSSVNEKDKVISMKKTMKRIIPIAACFVLVVAVTAFMGIQNHWFGARTYTVVLNNGDTLEYRISNPKDEYSYAYDYEVKDRTLTVDELHTLFPTLSYQTDSDYPFAIFKADTGEMLRLELSINDIRIHLAKTGLVPTDTVIDGNTGITDINGITIKTGYFVTDANSKGIKTAIFFAEFEMNDTVIYMELAGDEQNSDKFSKQLSDVAYSMINSNAPDISTIKYE